MGHYTTQALIAGATIADWAGHWEREPQTLVLKSVDESAFHRIYLDYLSDFAAVKLVKP